MQGRSEMHHSITPCLLFYQVKSAYHKLTDEKQRSVIIDNIEHVKNELDKERRRLISKGVKKSNAEMILLLNQRSRIELDV